MMHGSPEKGIFLDARDDGIYLVIDNSVSIDAEVKKNPMEIFTSAGLTDVDEFAVVAAFRSNDPRAEAKISESKRLEIKDEQAIIEISKDMMEAKISFIPGDPWFGKTMTSMDIVAAIKNAGITYGVLTDMINVIQQNRPPEGAAIQIAVGRPHVDGEDGRLEYQFDMSGETTQKPKLLDNGTVDYKAIESILKASKEQVLVIATPARMGVDGINVKGEKTTAKPGKIAPRLPRGKNTSVSEDESCLIADIDGQIQINNNRVDVVSQLIIGGDVGFETGNIDFTGSVEIKGTILNGFSVNVTENVEVRVAVEGANIRAGGNVNLLGGIKGMGKSIIQAGGDIFARYVERATLISGGNITSDSIMHSTIQCGSELRLEGKNGLLVGGTTYATKSVTAKTIGSSMSTATEITVGTSPNFIVRYNELETQYKKIKDEYDKERLVEAYKAANEDLKLRSLHARIHLRVEMDKIQKEMNELLVLLNSKDGIIRVSQTIYHGVKIIVGGVMLKVQDEMNACTLRNVEERVSVSPYIAY